MMEHFDVIIVGAGPSGVSAGLVLKRKGISCCLIDRATFPRQKNCGGLLTKKTVDLLDELGCGDVDSVVKSKLNRL